MQRRKQDFTTNQEKMRVQYEERERFVLKELLDTYIRLKHPEYIYECIISNINSGCSYDALLFIRDQDNNIIKRYFVEVKVRSVDYDDNTYILEKRKLTQLKKEQNFHTEYDLLYIVFTPNETLIYPLTEIINDKKLGKTKKQLMNDYTFASTTDKRNKVGYYLHKDLAIKIGYKYSDDKFDKWYKQRNEIKPTKIKEKKTKTVSLF